MSVTSQPIGDLTQCGVCGNYHWPHCVRYYYPQPIYNNYTDTSRIEALLAEILEELKAIRKGK